MQRTIVITGTGTGVGKTVLTAMLAARLHARGLGVAALKPICSGGRDDARLLHRALRGTVPLHEINPWHFRRPLAPLLAARQERQTVTLREIAAHVRGVARRFEIVLVEGAGGLLSPLGEGFSTRELIGALGAEALVVGRNELGAVNHVRLTLEALPPLIANHARVVLVQPRHASAASRGNAALLQEFIAQPLAILPWVSPDLLRTCTPPPRLARILDALL